MGTIKNLFRNSPWVMIAIAIHLILIAGAAIFYTATHGGEKAEESTTIRLATPRPESLEDLALPETIDRKAIPKNEEAELVTFEEDVYIPTTETVPEDLYKDRGDPDALDSAPTDSSTGGTAIGVGMVGHAGSRPSPFASRRLGKGVGNGRGGGATTGTERAVLEGLRWLARHQNEDGSWGATTFATHCTTDPPCLPRDSELGTRFDAGMTALALLAFLGQGISLDSKVQIVDTAMGTRRSGGGIVKKGIQWLLAHQKPDGSFSTVETTFEYPENDTLPTMAICEALGLSKTRMLKRPAQLAFDFLIAAQKRDKSGVRAGWGPGSYADLVRRRDSGEIDEAEFAKLNALVDPTVTCWVVMALQSAELCGLEVPADVLPAALAYVVAATAKEIDGVRVDDGDKYVYHPARQRALAMLTRTFAAAPITDPYFERGSKELAADAPDVGKDGLSVDFYYWYFGTIALNQYDGPDSPRPGAGKAWSKWNKALVDAILPLQNVSNQKNVCSRGGWLQGTRGNRRGLELRNTALNIMTLEVYYRFDNVFGSARTRQ